MQGINKFETCKSGRLAPFGFLTSYFLITGLNMKYLLAFFLFFSQNSFCQTSEVRGIVINGEDNSKLASASIFINNSSKGTISDANGAFNLGGISEKNFDLIISYTGFSTVSIKITPDNMNQVHTVKLFPRKQTMEDISIMVPEKDGWKTWGKFFTDMFLGESDFAKICTIENPKAMRFFNDKIHNRLSAYSNENLIIRNEALGYIIKYQLEEFNYDFKNKMVTYTGYTSFEDLKTGNEKKRSRWLKSREEAYSGSLMHFIRAVYSDSVAEQGFEVREKIRIPKSDTLFNKIYRKGNMPAVIDGNNHYTAIPGPISSFKEIPDFVDLINQKVFSFYDAVTFDSSLMKKEFYFDNYLQVIYKNANVKPDYLLAHEYSPLLKLKQNSDAHLIVDEPIIVEKDGSYFNPMNIIVSGYWGWMKMAEMLPSDYQ